MDTLSLPSRERGLKLIVLLRLLMENAVAPFAGAWIEMVIAVKVTLFVCVAPFAGAWIEIFVA